MQRRAATPPAFRRHRQQQIHDLAERVYVADDRRIAMRIADSSAL